MPSHKILAIAHLKGGSGSSTVVVNLAAEIAASGRDVLVIDLDPTAASTFCLLEETPADRLEDVLAGRTSLASVVRPTAQERLSIVPTSADLSTWDRKPERLPVVLSHVLEAAAEIADVVILDLPPAASTIVRSALAILPGGLVLAPVQARLLDLVGYSELVRLVEDLQGQNPELHIAGVIPTRTREAALCRDVVDALKKAGALVLPGIRESMLIARAPGAHRPFRLVYPKASANDDFRALARAISTKVLR